MRASASLYAIADHQSTENSVTEESKGSGSSAPASGICIFVLTTIIIMPYYQTMNSATQTETKITTVKDAIRVLTDEAKRQGADANDTSGAVRAIVNAYGFGFEAWFCVCCELADRSARRDGFVDQCDRAIKSPKFQAALAKHRTA